MTDTVTCPADGCDYTGLKQSVLGHYSGTKDGKHPGGWHKAQDLLEGTPASDSETKPTETSTEPTDTTSGENPTFGNADPVNEPEPARDTTERETDTSDSDPSCLKCESELYDFRQYSNGEYAIVNGHEVFIRGDYQCSNCGKWWFDE